MRQKINMMLKILITFFIALLSSQLSAQDILSQADQSVVRVVAKDGKGYDLGSGFVVAKDIVATNFHVIEHNQGIVVLKKNQSGKDIKSVKATVLWRSAEYDLALLEAPGLDLPVITVRESLPNKGSPVTTVGYPGAADEALDIAQIALVESTFTQGIIGRFIEASWSVNGQKLQIIQHSASVNSGNSGGPLLDNCGRVVGVNTAKALGIVQGTNATGLTVNQSDGIFYASHVSSLIRAMKEQGVPFKMTKEECSVQQPTINPKLEINVGTTKKADNSKLIALASAAILLAMGALFFSLSKSKTVRETYTQFQRRSRPGAAEASAYTKVSKSFRCALVGQDSNGNPVKLSFSEKALQSGVILGRDSLQSDVLVDDPSVSRRHAKLQYDSGRLLIRDMESTNGTWVNSKRLGPESATLSAGQSVNLGKVNLRVEGDF